MIDIMIVRILCRLGWHSWKPHCKRGRYAITGKVIGWYELSRICRRCRKRVSV